MVYFLKIAVTIIIFLKYLGHGHIRYKALLPQASICLRKRNININGAKLWKNSGVSKVLFFFHPQWFPFQFLSAKNLKAILPSLKGKRNISFGLTLDVEWSQVQENGLSSSPLHSCTTQCPQHSKVVRMRFGSSSSTLREYPSAEEY